MTYVLCEGCGWEVPSHAPWCVRGRLEARRLLRAQRLANLAHHVRCRSVIARFHAINHQRRLDNQARAHFSRCMLRSVEHNVLLKRLQERSG